MAKKSVKEEGVTVETIAPKKVKTDFKEGNIVIPASFGQIDREKFDKMFKGKISVDINDLWKKYQKYVRSNF